MEVRLVNFDGEPLGVVSRQEALDKAYENDLDLVEVSAKADPPVCRLMDFDKYRYEQSKKLKEAKKKQTVVETKEIKFRPKTDDHDYNFKKKHIVSFLEAGNKVKVIMQFRGREISHLDLGLEFLNHLVDEIAEYGTPESKPTREGRLITFILAPRSKRTS